MLDSGDHVLAVDDLYGGTLRLFETVRGRSAGLSFSYAGLDSRQSLEAAIRPETRMIWIETPTNPLLKIIDLELVAEVARQRGILTVVDNTFASPWLQRPLEWGIDIVIHSATKYLNGHSDVIGGIAVIGDNADLADRLAHLQNAIGAIAAPFDSYLVLRGLKTLAVRMQRHCENAAALARHLEAHAKVARVIYPGLPSHPGHALAMRQMNGQGGGMVACELDGGLDLARNFLERST